MLNEFLGIIIHLMKRIYRLFERRLKVTSKITNFSWRTVKAGSLKRLNLYLPEGGVGDDVVMARYEIEFLNEFEKLAQQGGCLYDIGAHIGIYTAGWIKLGGTIVHAFEPFTPSVSILEEVLRKNGMGESVKIHAVALGNYTGSGTLVSQKNESSRTGIIELEHIEAIANGGEESTVISHDIAVWRLDDLFQKKGLPKADVIKIDVEGAEFNVLEGAQETLMQYRPTILIEIHNIANGIKVADYMAKLNYKLHALGAKGKMKSLFLGMWTP